MPFMNRPDCRLSYVSRGSGEPSIVFVHGSCCAKEDWQAQLDALKATYRVVACDLRGHGQSRARPEDCTIPIFAGDVNRLVATLELGPTVLVGHSMGSRVVLQAAANRPDLTAAVVLVDGSRVAMDADHARELLASFDADRDFTAHQRRLFESMFLTSSSPELRERIVERAAEMQEEVVETQNRSLMMWDACDFPAAVSTIVAPILAIQSTFVDAALQRSTDRKSVV